MGPRIDKVEMTPNDHRTLAVSGPINWDSDEASATFMVVIAQVKPQGRIVYATGRGKRTYRPADLRWEADATVVEPDGQFAYDAASGWAIASVREASGEFEAYPWEVANLVVERPAVAVAP